MGTASHGLVGIYQEGGDPEPRVLDLTGAPGLKTASKTFTNEQRRMFNACPVR